MASTSTSYFLNNPGFQPPMEDVGLSETGDPQIWLSGNLEHDSLHWNCHTLGAHPPCLSTFGLLDPLLLSNYISRYVHPLHPHIPSYSNYISYIYIIYLSCHTGWLLVAPLNAISAGPVRCHPPFGKTHSLLVEMNIPLYPHISPSYI